MNLLDAPQPSVPIQTNARGGPATTMKLEYLIDGYNLMYHVRGGGPRAGPGNLERARAALLAWIAHHVQDPSRFTIVFDARGGSHPQQRRVAAGLSVLFAQGFPNADAAIADICGRHPHRQKLVVVSDDREVQASARRAKVRSVGCAEFTAHITRPQTRLPPPLPEKPLNPTEAEKQHWLAVFSIDPETGAASEFGDVQHSSAAERDAMARAKIEPTAKGAGDSIPDHAEKPPPPLRDDIEYWISVFEGRVRSVADADDFYRDMLSGDLGEGLDDQ